MAVSFTPCLLLPATPIHSYPTHEKLATKLQPSAGSCAYCCQCTWLVASGAGKRLGPDVRWTCGGHDIGSNLERRSQIAAFS